MSIRALYNQLRKANSKRWDEFRAKLASEGCLTRFERTVMKPKHQLKRVDFWIADCMVEYLGFTWENFRDNTVPSLEESKLPEKQKL